MGSVVSDSSVVLALFDPHDALHKLAAAATRAARDDGYSFVLPASVLAEVLVGAARRGPDERDTLRLSDALVLATADITDADVVLTGEKRWNGLDPRVHVVG